MREPVGRRRIGCNTWHRGTHWAEAVVQIESGDVEVLVNLMRTPQMMAKQMLQRVFTNLCGHQHTRHTCLKLLMRLLHPSIIDQETLSGSGRTIISVPLSTPNDDPMLLYPPHRP
jgi:hypothetical protein